MRAYLFFLLCFLLYKYQAKAKQTFPDEKTSDAIIIEDNMTFVIKSSHEAYLSVSIKNIINSKNASSNLKGVRLNYDDFHSIEDASVVITEPKTKKVVKKFKLKDFQDVNLDFTNLTSDNREKILQPTVNFYPYQIDINYKIKYKYSLFYPTWNDLPYENTRLEQSDLIVIDETGNSLRFKGINVEDPVITKEGEVITYHWRSVNKGPYQFEVLSDRLSKYGHVYLAPNNFEVDQFKGEMTSWESFGDWIYQLNSGRNDLDFSLIAGLEEKLKSVKNVEEKIKIIYDYLQQNTRYISIQLGIGGWQPLPTSFVHEKKYGDCKALSYYTKALLAHFGIQSHYTLINGGKNSREVQTDFPNPHFNHAILTVPLESDTVFLECTSQTNPYGYMGNFTSDRHALLIKEKESVLIRTKKYKTEDNLQTQKIDVLLTEDGAAMVKTEMTYQGLEIENDGFLSLYIKDSTERAKWYTDHLKQTNKEVFNFQLKPLTEGFIPLGGYSSFFRSQTEAKKSGKRLFISPMNYLNNYITRLPEVEKRLSSIIIKNGFTQIDTITYQIPEKFAVEAGLSDVSIETNYGSFKRFFSVNATELLICREFILSSGTYKPEEYKEFKGFTDAVIRKERQKIVLIQKE